MINEKSPLLLQIVKTNNFQLTIHHSSAVKQQINIKEQEAVPISSHQLS